MSFLVATNVVASQLPESRRTEKQHAHAKNCGPYDVHFKRRSSPYVMLFICRECPYVVHFKRSDCPYV